MIFYLSPSKQLLYGFCLLYGSMLSAIWLNNGYFLGKVIFSLILLHQWYHTINRHALRNIQSSIVRLYLRENYLFIEEQSGICYYGEFKECCYISKLLIIFMLPNKKRNKYNKYIIVLITPDSLPTLQFRRLSMWSRY